MTTFNTPQDNTIACTEIFGSIYADYNYGAKTTVRTSNALARTLIRFDLSSIPADATCVSATLHMWSATSTATRTENIYAILPANAGWVEGTSTGGVQSGSSDFSHRIHDTDGWAGSAGLNTPGTDYASVAIGTIAYPDNSIDTETTGNLDTATVQSWFGTTNPGILIVGTQSTSRNWHSDDAATAGYRPYLTVEYTEAGGATLSVFPGFGVHIA